jgi:hypothetical protein
MALAKINIIPIGTPPTNLGELLLTAMTGKFLI